MSRIDDDNYFQVSGWMINRLHLKGTELAVYAIIYGFTQAESQWFSGSRKYLADFTGVASNTTIDKCLANLVYRGLIEKKESVINGVHFNQYRALKICDTLPKNGTPPSQKMVHPLPKNGTNNKEIINRDNKDKQIPNGISPKRLKPIIFGYDTDSKIHGITPELLSYWEQQFPAVNVEQEIRSAEAWLDSNRTRRKHDIKRFLTTWLTRTQEKASRYPVNPQQQDMNPDYMKTRATFPGDEDAGKELTNGF